jgi:hypothetical protein
MTIDAMGFLRRVKGVLLSPAATFDSIIERRPGLAEPTAIFLSFAVAASLSSIIASMWSPIMRVSPLFLPASLLFTFVNVGVSCLIIFLILRYVEKLKHARWRMDLRLLYTLMGFSVIPMLLFRLYYPVSVYAVNVLMEAPSATMLLISKIPAALLTLWFAYLLSLSLNRHYSRDTSPRENMASILLGALLILGVFNLLHRITPFPTEPLPIVAAISWLLLSAFALGMWERTGRYPRARLAVIGALGIVVLANSGLLYLTVSEQDARMVETMRTAEVEFKIGVFTNGDMDNVTVLVPLPLFSSQTLDLKNTSAPYEKPPAYWNLRTPQTRGDRSPLGAIRMEGYELLFILEQEFAPSGDRTSLPKLEGRIVTRQYGEYLNLRISEIYSGEGIELVFRFLVPKEEYDQIKFPQPTLLFGDFGKCQPVLSNETCDLRVRSGISAHLQVTPNVGRGFELSSIREVFNETQQGWIRAEVFEPRG